MRPHNAIAIALLATVAFMAWRAQLWSVQAPGVAPAPLTLLPAELREPASFDVVLPSVPTGMRRLNERAGPLLVHYWAPWEQDSRAQSRLLDSLAHSAGFESLTVVLVCFDPFPSVARYVGRTRLKLPVMLDGEHLLSRALPCPSIPTTYVIDAGGRIAVRQSGMVDWWSPATRATLREVMAPAGVAVPAPAPAPPAAPRSPAPPVRASVTG